MSCYATHDIVFWMNRKTLFEGIAFALGACFVWGLIFVIPYFMKDFSSLEVVVGRYTFYGAISAAIFLKSKIQGSCNYPKHIWLKALYFSLMGTIGYYMFLVLAIRYSSPAICALVTGISPVAIAFYGNWRHKETHFKNLIIPSLLILMGLIIINIPEFLESPSPSSYILGLVFCFIALASWVWYVVANSKFLKFHPHVHSSDWSTLIGVCALLWACIFITLFGPFSGISFEITKYLSTEFLIGSALLGLICSWVGAFLWNKASFYLPVSLAGQLTIFETLFGVLFFYLFTQSLPPLIEVIGIITLLTAIVYGIRKFTKNKPLLN